MSADEMLICTVNTYLCSYGDIGYLISACIDIHPNAFLSI